MTIREQIQTIAKQVMEDAFAVLGTVKELSQNATTLEWTCRVEPIDDDEADYQQIKLQAAPGNGFLVMPAIDSIVGISLINETTGYISVYSQVDSIQLLDGSFDGIIKINDIVSKMNLIEQKQNEVLTALKTHTHSGNGVPSTAFNGIADLAETQKEDIENEKITHGTN